MMDPGDLETLAEETESIAKGNAAALDELTAMLESIRDRINTTLAVLHKLQED